MAASNSNSLADLPSFFETEFFTQHSKQAHIVFSQSKITKTCIASRTVTSESGSALTKPIGRAEASAGASLSARAILPPLSSVGFGTDDPEEKATPSEARILDCTVERGINSWIRSLIH
jgi:hypothetical protein